MTLARAGHWDKPSYLVLDIDPPAPDEFGLTIRAAQLVQQALADLDLAGAVKTSGAKGLHIFVPLTGEDTGDDAAACRTEIAVRAERIDPKLATTAFIKEDRHGKVFLDSTRAHGATVAAASSRSARHAGVVSRLLGRPAERHPGRLHDPQCRGLVGDSDPWADLMPPAKPLPKDLIEEGHTIPVARVQAMHEGKRRAREKRASE